MAPDVRDEVVDFIGELSERTEISERRLIKWLGVSRGKFYKWRERYGKVNEHNAHIPRDHWLLAEERQAILDFHERHPLEGYRRLTYMMMDQDVVAVSPTTVYRVLHAAKRLDRWQRTATKKGQGFDQPERAHQHWHVDIAYINLAGTFYFFMGVLDGMSRAIVHWDIRESMTEQDVELVLQKALELVPDASPRIISDNGPQFIAKDFKEFVRLTGMTHVRIRPYYPQSNGKIERLNKTLKEEAIRLRQPATLEEAKEVVRRFVEHYNSARLHSAIGYVTPNDMLAGRREAIWTERDRKLEAARELRRQRRQALAEERGAA